MSEDFLMDGALLDEGDLEPELPIELPLDDGDEPITSPQPVKKSDDDSVAPDDEEEEVDEDDLDVME